MRHLGRLKGSTLEFELFPQSLEDRAGKADIAGLRSLIMVLTKSLRLLIKPAKFLSLWLVVVCG